MTTSRDISGTVTSTVILNDLGGTYLTVDSGGVIDAASGSGVISAGSVPTDNVLVNSGSITGGIGSTAVDFSAGGILYNAKGATITGGTGAAGVIYDAQGATSTAVGILGSTVAYSLNNYGTIVGGAASSASGTGGTGLIVANSKGTGNAILDVTGDIVDSKGSYGAVQGGSGGKTGGVGMIVGAGVTATASGGTITGGSGTETGGAGVQLTSSSTLETVDGSQITGGSSNSDGGTGIVGFAGAQINNVKATISGGEGLKAGGVGVILNGATLFNQYLIEGGTNKVNSFHANAVDFGTGDGTLIEWATASLQGAIAGFAVGDTLDVAWVGAAYLASHMTIVNTTVTFTLPDATTLTFVGLQNDNFQFTSDSYGHGGTDITLGAACYVAGTLIKTPAGDRPIQSLGMGDAVLTDSGVPRTVRWVGRRSLDCRRHPTPQDVWPICIQAGALAEHSPSKDLWVSPGHALLIGGHLVQASLLINGVTVRQIPQDHIEYWHIELDQHDVLLANDVPAESYLDTGNRTAFENGGAFLDLHPDFKPRHWSETCFPLAQEGPALEQAKRQCLTRVMDLGYRLVTDADVHLQVDGQRIEPVWLEPQRLAFLLPAQHQSIQLCSRTFIPAHVTADNGDQRSLGLCVGGMQLDGRELDLAGPLTEGWHTLERREEDRWRWTSGRVPLPAGTHLIVVDLLGPGGLYHVAPADQDSGAAGGSVATSVAA